MLDVDDLGCGEERITRQLDGLELELVWGGKVDRGGAREVGRRLSDVAERVDESARGRVVVGEREGGEDAPVIRESDVEPPLLPQPVGDLIPRDVEIRDVDEHLQPVQIVRSLHAEQFLVQHVKAGDVVDGRPRAGGDLQCLGEQFVAAFDHLAPPPVERGVDHHIGTGGHQQIGALRELVLIDEVALNVEDRTLLEPGTHLVDADDADVRAGVHGPGGEIVVERQMSAPGFVDEQRLAPGVADLGNGLQIGARAVRTRADDQRTRGVGMTFPGLPDLGGRRRVRHVSRRIPPWGDPPWLQAREHQTRDDRLVAVTAEQQLAPCVTGHRQHRRLHRQRAATRREERAVGSHGVGHEFLRASEIPTSAAPVVQPIAGQHVVAKRLFTEDREDPLIGASTLAVTRRRETVPAEGVVVGQGIQQRCARMVHGARIPGRPRCNRAATVTRRVAARAACRRCGRRYPRRRC